MLPPKHLYDSLLQGQHRKLEWQLKPDLLVRTSQVCKSLSYQLILQQEILQFINPFSRCHSAGTLSLLSGRRLSVGHHQEGFH